MPQHEGDYFPSIGSYNTAADNQDCRYPTDEHPFGYLVELDIETPTAASKSSTEPPSYPAASTATPTQSEPWVATRGERGPIAILAQHVTRAATAALTDYRTGDVTTAIRRIHQRNNKPTT
jgi:hypothetical protein